MDIFSFYAAIIEMENRCIMAAFPHVYGEKSSHKQKIGELFWEVVSVSTFNSCRITIFDF